jgi:DNA modification methylase
VFPVALVEAVLETFTDPGDLVYEPFCGSGTQLIAAERAGRRCFAMELDPIYCDVAVRRWELATGKTAAPFGAEPAQQNATRRSKRRA